MKRKNMTLKLLKKILSNQISNKKKTPVPNTAVKITTKINFLLGSLNISIFNIFPIKLYQK